MPQERTSTVSLCPFPRSKNNICNRKLLRLPRKIFRCNSLLRWSMSLAQAGCLISAPSFPSSDISIANATSKCPRHSISFKGAFTSVDLQSGSAIARIWRCSFVKAFLARGLFPGVRLPGKRGQLVACKVTSQCKCASQFKVSCMC